MEKWERRLKNFEKAFGKLKEAVELYNSRNMSDLEKQGLIQSYEYTFELAWNLFKDYLEFQGLYNLKGPRDVIKESFKLGIIKNGDLWLEMLASRNLTSHTYDEYVAEEVVERIVNKYYYEFSLLLDEAKKWG